MKKNAECPLSFYLDYENRYSNRIRSFKIIQNISKKTKKWLHYLMIATFFNSKIFQNCKQRIFFRKKMFHMYIPSTNNGNIQNIEKKIFPPTLFWCDDDVHIYCYRWKNNGMEFISGNGDKKKISIVSQITHTHTYLDFFLTNKLMIFKWTKKTRLIQYTRTHTCRQRQMPIKWKKINNKKKSI